jgi:hypothetical protein
VSPPRARTACTQNHAQNTTAKAQGRRDSNEGQAPAKCIREPHPRTAPPRNPEAPPGRRRPTLDFIPSFHSSTLPASCLNFTVLLRCEDEHYKNNVLHTSSVITRQHAHAHVTPERQSKTVSRQAHEVHRRSQRRSRRTVGGRSASGSTTVSTVREISRRDLKVEVTRDRTAYGGVHFGLALSSPRLLAAWFGPGAVCSATVLRVPFSIKPLASPRLVGPGPALPRQARSSSTTAPSAPLQARVLCVSRDTPRPSRSCCT